MTQEEFNELATGDIIRRVKPGTSKSYVVTESFGNFVIAADIVHASNPTEWILVSKVLERHP